MLVKSTYTVLETAVNFKLYQSSQIMLIVTSIDWDRIRMKQINIISNNQLPVPTIISKFKALWKTKNNKQPNMQTENREKHMQTMQEGPLRLSTEKSAKTQQFA